MPVSVKIGGVWKTATAVYNKVGGVWKTASDMPVKIGGVWKTGILAPATGYYAIAHAILSADSTVTFSSIPQGYTDLKIVTSLRGSIVNNNAYIQFNGVTSGYARYLLYSSGSALTASSSNALNAGDIYVANNVSGTSHRATSVIDIPSYSNTTKEKTFLGYQGNQYGGTPSSAIAGYNLANTAAVSSITITPTSGTLTGTITLYGIKAAS